MTRKSPLTPVRYTPNFFSIDISSIGIKDAYQQLEHPFFSLSKKPDVKIRSYEDRRGNTLEIMPSIRGLPTIWDKDLLIFAISHITARIKNGEEASPTIRFHIADVIEFGQMTKSSTTYRRLDAALLRLAGCTLRTNIKTGGKVTTDIFHIIDKATIKRDYDNNDRLEYCEFTLSDWLFRAVKAMEVLTLHPDYFRLRRALDRRIYEIARKHCGAQAEWRISLPLLHKKTGSTGDLKEFRRMMRRTIAAGDLLDYGVAYEAGRDIVVFCRKEGSLLDQALASNGNDEIRLSAATAAKAREIHGANVDLAAAERDWRAWLRTGGLVPTSPSAMFLKFLDTWIARRGRAATAAANEGHEPDYITKPRAAWWASFSEEDRQRWRERVGERIEVDGEAVFRSEAALTRLAYERRWPNRYSPGDGHPPAPPQLFEYFAAETGVPADEIERGWREWYGPRRDVMSSSLAGSVAIYIKRMAEDKPGK